jgi:SulP family sulfate permease
LLIVLWWPRWVKSVPAPLVAIVVLTLFTVFTGKRCRPWATKADAGGLPGFTEWRVPFNLTTLGIIWPCALSIAFVGLLESLLTARLVDDLTHTPSSKSRKAPGWVSPIFSRVFTAVSPVAQ